jgi:hypothetical protein
MAWFLNQFPVHSGIAILDVGGEPDTWHELSPVPKVTLLNVEDHCQGLLKTIVADGCRIPLPDKSFDVIYSNSVIEHLGNEDRQRTFAREVMRVGKGYWIQTPNFWFPIEPHFLFPFFHWLPKVLRKFIVRYFTPWGLLLKPSRQFADDYVDEIKLLSTGQLKKLFPEAEIMREKVFGLTKSLIAIGYPPSTYQDR